MMSNFRRSGSFTLSPQKHGFNIPGNFITPSNRRRSSTTSVNSLVLLDRPANNEEAEKRERQLTRLQQLQSRSVTSPTATPNDRRKSLNTFAGLTNQQITDHYAKCIQLSAENKINIKNAFNLQLIDYMTELLKRKDSEMNNFQVASCTLDASTKIYGYRVDSVHTDTLKMAGGLGRTKDKPDTEHGDSGAEGNDGTTGKRKTKTKKCVTIEKNLKNLNIAHFDLEFDVDPLFKKTASQFDDGRSGGGQFLNTLQMLDDTCQLVLDSETVLQYLMEEHDESCNETVTIPPLPEATKLISPTFATFEFSSWKLSDEDTTFTDLSKAQHEQTKEDHAFDMNATPEPLDPDAFDAGGMNDPYDDDIAMEDETMITVGGGGCHQGPRPPPPQLEIVHLKDHLANTPLEYSYFDTRVMSAWAGPGHWKVKPLVRASRTDSTKDGQKSKDRVKKDFTLDYNGELEFERHFAVLRRATKLSQYTVKKWTTTNNTLPADLHYDPAKFSKLYLRPGIVIRRQAPEKPPAEIDDEVTDYDYDNKNDKENYCPDIEEGSNYADNSAPGYDDTDIFSQTVLPSQPNQADMDDKTKDFLGTNLVEAPNKVSQIHIGYARTAKKMDMKKLKTSIWSLLCDADSNKENNRNVELEKMKGNSQKEFSEVYSDLFPRLPSKMAENLSVPLAFIALLHLANDHSLMLASKEELGDFIITQD